MSIERIRAAMYGDANPNPIKESTENHQIPSKLEIKTADGNYVTITQDGKTYVINSAEYVADIASQLAELQRVSKKMQSDYRRLVVQNNQLAKVVNELKRELKNKVDKF